MFCAIEVGEKRTKLLVATLGKGTFLPCHIGTVATAGYSEGVITDYNLFTKMIEELIDGTNNRFEGRNVHLCLIMPAETNKVYKKNVSINTTGADKIISIDDVNLIRLHASIIDSTEEETIEINPISYSLNNARIFSTPPIGEYSPTLNMTTFIVTMNKNMARTFVDLVGTKTSVNSIISRGNALVSYLFAYQSLPTFLVLEIGAKKSYLYLSIDGLFTKMEQLNFGTLSIASAIASKYQIDLDLANDLIKDFSTVEVNEEPIYKLEDGYIYLDDLNQLIDEGVEALCREVVTKAKMMVGSRQFHIYCVGGGAEIENIFKCWCDLDLTISILKPQMVGVRNLTYCALVGAIISSYLSLNKINRPRREVVMPTGEETASYLISQLYKKGN